MCSPGLTWASWAADKAGETGPFRVSAICIGRCVGDALALDALSVEFEADGLILSAADSAAQCGGATTPAITSAARPLPVTSREREIVALIAEGLSNRQIAERLTVSVRTVEGHIYRACIKLDVADRDKLARIIRQGLNR
jgi:DNA-binding NarL/FixJ family response regulator